MKQNHQTLKQIVIGAAAAIIAVLVIGIVNWVSKEGFIIHWLGGLTESDLKRQDIRERLRGPEGPPGPSIHLPVGSIMAFDLPNGCPEGWENFDAGAGRFIIGVGRDYKLPYIGGKPEYQIGGKPSQILEIGHLPVHTHGVNDPAHTHTALAPNNDADAPGSQGWPRNDVHKRFRTSDRPTPSSHYFDKEVHRDALRTSKTGITIEKTGDGAPIDTMPPYIALYFCRKKVTK